MIEEYPPPLFVFFCYVGMAIGAAFLVAVGLQILFNLL
jgi:hypothetical protein